MSDTTTTMDATLTIKVRMDLGEGLEPAKVDMADLRKTLGQELARQLVGVLVEVAYDRPNDHNAYATVETGSATVEDIVLDDVVRAVQDATASTRQDAS